VKNALAPLLNNAGKQLREEHHSLILCMA